MTPIVFYHGNCPDGFGAAYAAWLVFKNNAEYVPCGYGDVPPPVTGRDVYILDFCFTPEVMTRIDSEASKVVLLDHHLTSQQKLKSFSCRCGVIHFDLTKSGARLAWEYFHPEKEVIALIKHIEDRDLWKWRYPETGSYLAALDAEGFDFEKWHAVASLDATATSAYVLRGTAMNDKFRSLGGSIAEKALPLTLLGTPGWAVNAVSEFSSEVGGRLARKGGTFGAVWYLPSADTIKVSLRSVAPFEVEPIARKFGGGGHPQAASFNLPIRLLTKFLSGEINPEDLS
ncbi:DHHA1 domain-containing protein [Nostoc sp. CHAB 5834]|nr:DHHA1 domain-containing protein [Nostoc sp. CHAB 5834]